MFDPAIAAGAPLGRQIRDMSPMRLIVFHDPSISGMGSV
jgi:hypothetical protein